MRIWGTFPTPHVPLSHTGLPGMMAASSESLDMRLTASTVVANLRRVEWTKVEGSEEKKERLEREEIRDQGNPKRPSANAASTSSHPDNSAKPAQSAAPSTPPASGVPTGVLHPVGT
jgi:hypothetical protein